MREVGTIGEWTFEHHRMARFEDTRVFSFVAALDKAGSRWGWVVMLPGRDRKSRTTGESETALQGALAADAVAAELVSGAADPKVVEQWVADHLAWMNDAEQGETESTVQWHRGTPKK